jgi:hypothetical protein
MNTETFRFVIVHTHKNLAELAALLEVLARHYQE